MELEESANFSGEDAGLGGAPEHLVVPPDDFGFLQ